MSGQHFWPPFLCGNDPCPENILDKEQLAMRDRFVDEYFSTTDEVSACVRMGFDQKTAQNYAKWFMSDTYVLRKLKEFILSLGTFSLDNPRETRRAICNHYALISRRGNQSEKFEALKALREMLEEANSASKGK